MIKAWKLPLTIPKLNFIKESLNKRIDEVNQLIHHVIYNVDNESDIPKNDYFNLSFESSVEYLIPIFERIYNLESNKKKWALCFDELEFAPNWLQDTLFKSLRSRNQYILYKLSASPILTLELERSLQGEYKPTSGNDFTLIKTWNSKGNEKFSKQIITDLVTKKFGKKNVSDFFGTNPIYNKGGDSYVKGSDFHAQILELIQKDSSFKSFLESKKIDPSNPVAQGKHDKDTVFRKIKPVVYFRNFYNNLKQNTEESSEMSKRRLRTSELFFGIEVLCKICDGNPRWLIGIITEILSKSDGQTVDKSLQFRELRNAAKRFQNVIANIPIGPNNKRTLTGIIDKIGKYFENEVHGSEFKMDPDGTFTVDDSKNLVSDDIIKLLEKGISQGAIILTESNDDVINFEIRGQRFKLSYLFFVLYKLPLRNYNPVKISTCLGANFIENNNQPTLFSNSTDGN